MNYSPDLAEIRFGCGLSPVVPAPVSGQDLIDRLVAPDAMSSRFPIESYSAFRQRQLEYSRNVIKRRKAKGTGREQEFQDRADEVRRGARQAWNSWLGQSVLRWSYTEQGVRERLVLFWADHFTAQGKAGILKFAAPAYVEEAIRPNVTGRFADLLIAAVTHPLMLHYLDQDRSAGPGSSVAKKNKRLNGLNENLAREVLELHTLGVDGPYTQDDVRQLAELFTGLSQNAKEGFRFRAQMAEPGRETVLGRTYGDGTAELEPIIEVLEDLAAHPVTAQHLCQKLAVHFLADHPDTGLVEHMTAQYMRTGGDLTAVFTAMLEHPASWMPVLQNVKPPFAFVASACRALAVDPVHMSRRGGKPLVRFFQAPLMVMGQAWLAPGGPDGFPEEDEAWITPQGLAARMRWAMVAPARLQPDLPDPRDFPARTLGQFMTPEVGFAAEAAETRAEAIGLTLISPAFQRR